MWVIATKTKGEKQDEDAEHLVRPAPKFKPSRHDRKREHLLNEDNAEKADKDTSRNYKDIGGSVKQAEEQERIPAKSRETGRTVMISPDTLKEKPNEYEAIERDETEEKDPAKAVNEMSKLHKDIEDGVSNLRPQVDKNRAEAGKALHEMGKADPKIDNLLKQLITKGSDLNGIISQNPDFPAARFFQDKLPAGLKTLYDVQQAYLSGKPEEPAKGKKPKAKPPAEPPAGADKPSTPAAPASKSEPAGEPAKAEAPKKEPAKAESPAKDTEKVEKPAPPEPKPEAEKAGVSKPQRRPVSRAEVEESTLLLADTFTPEVAADLIASNVHPDDVKTLVRDYRLARSNVDTKFKDKDFVSKVARFFEIDPNQVKPPATWKDAVGKEVPFDSLPPEEQAEGMRQHQMRTVALSLAAKDALARKLSQRGALTGKPKIPEELTGKIASLMLSPKPLADSAKAVQETFDSVVKRGASQKISDGAIRNLLEQTRGHKTATNISKAYFQANDYNEAKTRFLDPSSSESVSEWDSPSRIVSGLERAGRFLDGRNELYGDFTTHPALTMFRVKVLDRLKALEPAKYPVVREKLAKVEEAEYKTAKAKWEKAHKKWEEAKKSHDEAFSNYFTTLKGEPPGQFTEEKPIAPVEPVPAEPKGEDPWASILKTAGISSYANGTMMGTTTKTGVYHGIEPAKNDPGPYVGWQQPHQRDLNSSDETVILADAKDWLKSPLLTVAVDNMVPDTKYRAALDLAIYASKYNGAIDPVRYNILLASLMGEPEPSVGETLQTKQSSFENSTNSGGTRVMKASSEVRKFAAVATESNPELAFDLLAFADRLAEDEAKDDQQQAQQKQAQDQDQKSQQQDDTQKEASSKYATLRAEVIKTAAALDPDKRAVVLPILQAIKTLG